MDPSYVPTVADYELQRERDPVSQTFHPYIFALLLGLVTFFVTRKVPQTLAIILAYLLLRMLFR